VRIGGGLWLWGIGDVVPQARTGFSLRGWGGGLVSGCGHQRGELCGCGLGRDRERAGEGEVDGER
jgi:hypothetical protein